MYPKAMQAYRGWEKGIPATDAGEKKEDNGLGMVIGMTGTSPRTIR